MRCRGVLSVIVNLPEVRIHLGIGLGWLARAQTGGYWTVPMATAAPPEQHGDRDKGRSAVPRAPAGGPVQGGGRQDDKLLERGLDRGPDRELRSRPGTLANSPEVREQPNSKGQAGGAWTPCGRRLQTADPETALAISEWVKTAVLPGD